ncbi:MAG: HAMP domain-containing protein [Myxococcales bacterium]|nr:HAMP domain-containing protein [Myxococcales bacterium]
MPLALRLALAFVLVAIGATALWGVRVRTTSRRLMEADFSARIEAATHEVEESLQSEATQLKDLTVPLCARATFVEKALVDLERVKGDPLTLETGSLLSIDHHVPAEAAARSLDELALVTPDGFIVSSSDTKTRRTKNPRLGKLIQEADKPAVRLRPQAAGGELSLEVACSKSQRSLVLGLVGARRIENILDRVGRAHGATLAVLPSGEAPPPSSDGQEVRVVEVKAVPGLSVVATLSRARLRDALELLDREIIVSGAAGAGAALLLALLLGRSLAKPLRELARETGEVLSGEPRPVRARGGREIRVLAETFNKTIDELSRMKKRLAVTERIAARREIARQVAHEIKNPLAPIRAAVETLRRLRDRGDERFDEYFDEATRTVLEEVHRITNIVSEFTKFQRLPAPNPEPMDLVQAARGVVSLHAADPEMVKTGDPDAPPRVELQAGDIPPVRADKDQVIQVLTNLVQNGLEAASAVRADPRVLVTIDKQGKDKVRIVVRDNGPGVSEEMRERLFEPYATSKATGTGLGLAICQRIVFEHGGEIVYRPATKGGAVFEITLPIAGPSLLEKPLETTAQPVSRHQHGSEEDSG